jgi:uncharacterized protein, YhcH/YjgK/YiaL family
MALFGSIQTLRQQVYPRDQFAAAWAYLEELFAPGSAEGERMRAVAVGETKRVELSGGAFALEQAYWTKTRPEGFFESHRKFVDVQVIFEGEERMEVVDVSRAKVREAYREERDLVMYEDCAGASVLTLRAGEAAVYFPADVHMPGLRCADGEARLVRKTVVKVPVIG